MQVKKLVTIICLFCLLSAGPAFALSGDVVREGMNAAAITMVGGCETALAGNVTSYTTTAGIAGSGTDFTIFDPGDTMCINGTAYTISAVGSATALTLTTAPSSAGTYSVLYDASPFTYSTGDGESRFSINKSGQFDGIIANAVTADTAIAAGDSLTLTGGGVYALLGSDGAGGYTAVTMSSNPQVADGKHGQVIIIMGRSDTYTITFVDGSGLALADDRDITLGKGNLLYLMYNATDDIWYEISRSDPIPNMTSDTAIAAGDSLTLTVGSGTYALVGSDGSSYTEVTMSSNPQIADGYNNQEITLMGRDDTNTVTFVDGSGLALAGGANMALGKGDVLTLIYHKVDDIWYEKTRSAN